MGSKQISDGALTTLLRELRKEVGGLQGEARAVITNSEDPRELTARLDDARVKLLGQLAVAREAAGRKRGRRPFPGEVPLKGLLEEVDTAQKWLRSEARKVEDSSSSLPSGYSLLDLQLATAQLLGSYRFVQKALSDSSLLDRVDDVLRVDQEDLRLSSEGALEHLWELVQEGANYLSSKAQEIPENLQRRITQVGRFREELLPLIPLARKVQTWVERSQQYQQGLFSLEASLENSVPSSVVVPSNPGSLDNSLIESICTAAVFGPSVAYSRGIANQHRAEQAVKQVIYRRVGSLATQAASFLHSLSAFATTDELSCAWQELSSLTQKVEVLRQAYDSLRIGDDQEIDFETQFKELYDVHTVISSAYLRLFAPVGKREQSLARKIGKRAKELDDPSTDDVDLATLATVVTDVAEYQKLTESRRFDPSLADHPLLAELYKAQRREFDSVDPQSLEVITRIQEIVEASGFELVGASYVLTH